KPGRLRCRSARFNQSADQRPALTVGATGKDSAHERRHGLEPHRRTRSDRFFRGGAARARSPGRGRRNTSASRERRYLVTIPPLRERPAFDALAKHHAELVGRHLRELFAEDPARGERLWAEAAGLYLDYSKNRITDETLRLLLALAEACSLRERIDAMFRGDKINTTEKRAVLHVALRAPPNEHIHVDGRNGR